MRLIYSKMKNLKAFFLFLILTVFYSCSKDDDSNEPSAEQLPGIEGEWLLEEYYYTRTSTLSETKSSLPHSYYAEAMDLDVTLNIDIEPNIWKMKGNFTLRINSTEEGDSQKEEMIVEDMENTGVFYFDDYWFDADNYDANLPPRGEINPMNFSAFVIEDLTETRLELTISEGTAFQENGIPAMINRYGTQVYRRL